MNQPTATPITALVVDDEPLARRGLALRLEGLEGVELVGQAASGSRAIELVAQLRPQLLFLDIQMPGMDGFEVVRELSRQAHFPLVVFVTAYDEYAVKAFEARALDYLLKPVELDRLEATLVRVRKRLQQQQVMRERERLVGFVADITGESPEEVDRRLRERQPLGEFARDDILRIKDGSDIINVNMGDIDWIDAAGDYMCIHAGGETHIMRSTMKELESMLDAERFQRIHRSTIVNLTRVKRVSSHINGEYFLQLQNGVELKMSRSYKSKIEHFR
jgi:two-component system LytT family response regulator